MAGGGALPVRRPDVEVLEIPCDRLVTEIAQSCPFRSPKVNCSQREREVPLPRTPYATRANPDAGGQTWHAGLRIVSPKLQTRMASQQPSLSRPITSRAGEHESRSLQAVFP